MDGDVLGSLRIITASARLDWEKSSLIVGQRQPLVSPLNPTSIAAVWFPPLTGAGNLWQWRPQIMAEHRAGLGDSSQLIVQGGVTSGLLNALVAEDLPGPGTVFLGVEWKFVRAVGVGEEITARAEVIGVRDELKGQLPVGLAVLKAGVARPHDEIAAELVEKVRAEVGPVASFKRALIVDALPKTRSGKILRGVLRRIADAEPYTMPATIEDPAVLARVGERLEQLRAGER